ncbi:G protein subunit beta [Diaporthe eres]
MKAAAQPKTRPTDHEQMDAEFSRKHAELMAQTLIDVSPEAMQARIQQARREAETLKDRIKRKKDELSDTARKIPFYITHISQFIRGTPIASSYPALLTQSPTVRQVAAQAHEAMPKNQLMKMKRKLDKIFEMQMHWEKLERKTMKLGLKAMKLGESVTAQDQRLPAEVRSSLNSSYRARERRFLPLEINGKPAHALPDTGIIGNAISADYALEIGAVIERPPSKHNFLNAKNQPFESVGTTKLTISIPGALSKTSPGREWVCSFAVVEHLAAPLVLGNQFLRKTEALVSLAHLTVRKTLSVVSDKVDQLKKVWRFMHMNLPTQKLGCSLDAEPAFAALDSGSDIDVVSLTYAKFREWQIKKLPEGEGYVLLANNELVKLAGYVETTLGIRGGCIPRRLYVLNGLVCDVVLGDPTIESLDIFNKFQSSLVDTTAVEDMDPFHMIQWVEEIDHIEHELEELLAERPGAASSGTAKTGWRSFFPEAALRKGRSAEGEGKQALNRINLSFPAHFQRQGL